MERKKQILDQRRLYTERMRLQKGVFSSLANAAGHIGELYADFVQSDEVRNSMRATADLFDVLEASGTAGKIAAFLGKAFIAVKIADITGIGSLVKFLVTTIGKKLITEESVQALAGNISNLTNTQKDRPGRNSRTTDGRWKLPIYSSDQPQNTV